MGTFKDQLISVGSLFVISGNPLEPDSVSAADNQGKEEEMNACPCTCTTKVAVDLTIMLYHTAPSVNGDCTQDKVHTAQWHDFSHYHGNKYVVLRALSVVCG